MKAKVLALLAVGLLAGPTIANATLLNFELTDGTNDVVFQLDFNLTPPNDLVVGVGFTDVSFSVNGSLDAGNVAFYFSTNYGGGLSIIANGMALLNQGGPQIFTGDYPSPVFSPGVYSLEDIGTTEFFNTDFQLTISSVPEPGTLALLGLGLVGLGLSRHRKVLTAHK